MLVLLLYPFGCTGICQELGSLQLQEQPGMVLRQGHLCVEHCSQGLLQSCSSGKRVWGRRVCLPCTLAAAVVLLQRPVEAAYAVSACMPCHLDVWPSVCMHVWSCAVHPLVICCCILPGWQLAVQLQTSA
jgi:hypothetical protein